MSFITSLGDFVTTWSRAAFGVITYQLNQTAPCGGIHNFYWANKRISDMMQR